MKKLLFKPFEYYSESKLLIVGAIATILGTYFASLFNARFDGVLDLHFVDSSILGQIALDVVINSITMVTLLFIAGKLINGKTRFIDILNTSLVAKIPMYFLVFLNINQTLAFPTTTDINEIQLFALENIVMIIALAVLSVIAIVWYIALLFNGFKTATNGKGTKLILYFIGVIILAEIISKLFIYYFN